MYTQIYKNSNFQAHAGTDKPSGKSEKIMKIWVEYLLAVSDHVSDFARVQPFVESQAAPHLGISEWKHQI